MACVSLWSWHLVLIFTSTFKNLSLQLINILQIESSLGVWGALWCLIHYTHFSVSILLTLSVAAAIDFAFCPAILILVCLVLSCSLLPVSPVLPILFLSSRLYWPLSCCSCHISFSHWFLVPVLSIFSSCVFLIQSCSSVKLHSLRFLWGSLFQPFWHHNFRRFPVLSSVLNNCLLPPSYPGLIQEGWTTCSSVFFH